MRRFGLEGDVNRNRRPRARVRRTKPTGEMNGLERAWSQDLDLRVLSGEIASYIYEGVKFRLADRTWYTPDFFVILADGTIEIHEAKGFMEEDANVKIKVAAEMFPWFDWILIKKRTKKEGGGWNIRRIGKHTQKE